MRYAFCLAKRGKGTVSPNPMVGCVIVKNGKIVGKGYHEYFGGPHAEINALRAAGERAIGSTLYVTLEPCNHFGKTPPCTDAIIKARIGRVVVAVRDPNPRTNGRGLEKLKRNSIKVSEGILAEEARRANPSCFQAGRKGKRMVIVKFAMSADGKIATRTGDSKWISSVKSREFVHKLRSDVDAIIVGANTVLQDNPELTSHGWGRNPVRIVIDPKLKVPLNRRVFDGTAPTIVFHSSTAMKGKLAELARRKIFTVRLPKNNGRMDFENIIAKLNDFSLDRVLIEGGGETIASALDARVVTDVLMFVAPKIIGGRSAITPVEGTGVVAVRNALRLIDLKSKKIGADFLITAKVAHTVRAERN